MLVKLVFTSGYDQLQQLRYMLLGCGTVVPTQLTGFVGMHEQFLTCPYPNLKWPHQVQRCVDKLLRLQRAPSLDPVDQEAHPWQTRIPHHLGRKVDPAHKRTAVNPLFPSMPAFHTGRIQQVLPHIGGLHGDLFTVLREWNVCSTDHTQGADHEFSRALDLVKASILEEVRGEQGAQDST